MSLLNKIITWARIKSPWIIHFNSGACNACDIEIVASLTPRFDIERFGIILQQQCCVCHVVAPLSGVACVVLEFDSVDSEGVGIVVAA